MHRQAFDRGSVDAYVEAVRGQLSSAALSEATARAAAQIPGEGDAAAKVSSALRPASTGPCSDSRSSTWKATEYTPGTWMRTGS